MFQWFFDRGFGFIAEDSGSEWFCHIRDVAPDDKPWIRPRDRVSFEVGNSPDGRHCAMNVVITDTA